MDANKREVIHVHWRLLRVAQLFLAAVSPTFLSAGFDQFQPRLEPPGDAFWKALRDAGSQEWLRYEYTAAFWLAVKGIYRVKGRLHGF
jgi:hypothetical protein